MTRCVTLLNQSYITLMYIYPHCSWVCVISEPWLGIQPVPVYYYWHFYFLTATEGKWSWFPLVIPSLAHLPPDGVRAVWHITLIVAFRKHNSSSLTEERTSRNSYKSWTSWWLHSQEITGGMMWAESCRLTWHVLMRRRLVKHWWCTGCCDINSVADWLQWEEEQSAAVTEEHPHHFLSLSPPTCCTSQVLVLLFIYARLVFQF